MNDPRVFAECGFYPKLFFLFASSATVGIQIWVTFLAGPFTLQVVNRHIFLQIQSKLFPVFFVVTSILSTIQLASISVCSFGGFSDDEWTLIYLSSFTLLMFLLNLFIFTPITTDIFMKKMKMEKEEGVIYPATTPALENSEMYHNLLTRGRNYHIISMLSSVSATCVSFYMIYFITELFL